MGMLKSELSWGKWLIVSIGWRRPNLHEECTCLGYMNIIRNTCTLTTTHGVPVFLLLVENKRTLAIGCQFENLQTEKYCMGVKWLICRVVVVSFTPLGKLFLGGAVYILFCALIFPLCTQPHVLTCFEFSFLPPGFQESLVLSGSACVCARGGVCVCEWGVCGALL